MKTHSERGRPKPLLADRNPKMQKWPQRAQLGGAQRARQEAKARLRETGAAPGCKAGSDRDFKHRNCTKLKKKKETYSEDCFRTLLPLTLCLIFSFKQLHALSSGFKAMVTQYCTSGVEICLRACGGHGYSSLSGLPSLYTKIIASCIYEGENTILLLQTAR